MTGDEERTGVEGYGSVGVPPRGRRARRARRAEQAREAAVAQQIAHARRRAQQVALVTDLGADPTGTPTRV